MAEIFKILDQNLFKYVYEEVLKRYPDFTFMHSSLGQGKLAREERFFKLLLQPKKDYIMYYKGRVSLHVDETLNSEKVAKDSFIINDNGKWNYKDIIIHEAGNRNQSDAAVLDAVLYMIKFYHSLSQPIQELIQDTVNNENLCKEQIVETIKLETTTLKDLFRKPLSLPSYQRAYEWKDEHVNALLEDTYDAFTNEKSYILGTIILYQNEKGGYDIVDGQQRLVTLSILFKDKLTQNSLLSTEFNNLKSQYYIQNTNRIIVDYLKNKDKDNYLDYFFEKKNHALRSLHSPKTTISCVHFLRQFE